ncbi:CaiB/BaiF CoA transferase family protein [Propylenella binzhouense]|uniref:CoA transferase n=1 Tax=Propylenella binzhouense TaxID=2555902 RepID=A0A964T1G3_9HYPH|nr:CaiB/BaiF CoA-transferase family protein [Propylenella binzhouense]MYZ46575.1 CoA transferase [Propylenella binzhouense]
MKLQGIRVVDLSRFLPGPALTQTMADHGAEVIKVEAVAGGEPTREIGEARDGVSVYFANTNRGKKSLALDLKSPDGVEALLRLAETADVMIESFRPGVAARLGVDYAAVAARAPRIVYASISAFGQTGPYRHLAGHDLAIEAMTGVLSLNRGKDGAPAIPGVPAADVISSAMTLSGILMALLRRAQTGRGDYLDMSMADCLLTGVLNNLDTAMVRREQPDLSRSRSVGGNALYAVYKTACGGHIALGGQEPKFAANLLGALGRSDLAAVANLPPGPEQDPLREFLKGTFATRSRDDWVSFFAGKDVPLAPLKTLPEALDDPQFRERGIVATDARGWDHIGTPIRYADEPAAPDWRVPALGEDSRAVLSTLGYDETAINDLVRRRVTGEPSTLEIARHSGSAGSAAGAAEGVS